MQVGLIGFPVGHSISPAFQQAAFDALGLDVQYQLWETSADRIAEVVGRLRQPDFLGANVTIPHKQAVASLLDSVDPVARVVGAVNTIVRADDRLVGYNTDVEGFTRALEIDGGSSMSSRRFVVLGAGGAARAVVTAILLGDPASVVILARRTEQAIALLNDLNRAGLSNATTHAHPLPLATRDTNAERAVRSADVVVNTTPVGMLHHPTEGSVPLPTDWLAPDQLVYDLVYNPPETPLLEAARERGARVLNGLPMLVYQGAAAFEQWTGRAAPVELMTKRAREALRG